MAPCPKQLCSVSEILGTLCSVYTFATVLLAAITQSEPTLRCAVESPQEKCAMRDSWV